MIRLKNHEKRTKLSTQKKKIPNFYWLKLCVMNSKRRDRKKKVSFKFKILFFSTVSRFTFNFLNLQSVNVKRQKDQMYRMKTLLKSPNPIMEIQAPKKNQKIL